MVALREYEQDDDGRRRAPGRQGPRDNGRGPGPAIISIFRPRGIAPGEMLPLVRKDALPDRPERYVDTGCELAMACLSCPLPRCQYDAPNSARTWLLAARDREIVVLRRKHRAPISALMRTYGVSRRTVFRILAEDGGARMDDRGWMTTDD